MLGRSIDTDTYSSYECECWGTFEYKWSSGRRKLVMNQTQELKPV